MQREDIKAIYNKESTEHKFCAKAGCWDAVGKKFSDTGFCGRFNKDGAFQHIETSAADDAPSRPSPPPPVGMNKVTHAELMALSTEKKRSLSPRSLNPLLREVRACKKQFDKIEETLIALGAEDDGKC